MTKDDPMGQSRHDLFANRTLWLDREGMDVACSRFFAAWMQSEQRPGGYKPGEGLNAVQMQEVWYTAWAAAVAAFSFVMEGNLGPKPEDGQ